MRHRVYPPVLPRLQHPRVTQVLTPPRPKLRTERSSKTQRRSRARQPKGSVAASSPRKHVPNVYGPSHNRNASDFQPPLSPIDTLASVAPRSRALHSRNAHQNELVPKSYHHLSKRLPISSSIVRLVQPRATCRRRHGGGMWSKR